MDNAFDAVDCMAADVLFLLFLRFIIATIIG